MAAAQRQFLEAKYDDYAGTNGSGAAFCRSATLIFMALLLLRHALVFTNGDEEDDDASVIFSLFLLRVAGFLLPCYIMAWAISILQRRRQRQIVLKNLDNHFSCWEKLGGNDYNYAFFQGRSMEELMGYVPEVVKSIIDTAKGHLLSSGLLNCLYCVMQGHLHSNGLLNYFCCVMNGLQCMQPFVQKATYSRMVCSIVSAV